MLGEWLFTGYLGEKHSRGRAGQKYGDPEAGESSPGERAALVREQQRVRRKRGESN